MCTRFWPQHQGGRQLETPNDVFNKIRPIIADLLKVDPNHVQMKSAFKVDLNADSLSLIEIAEAIEAAFPGLKVNDDALSDIITVGDTVNLIVNFLNS